ncbi:hypothetical protein TNIN_408371 [Trichonephila inaurata madagascariensis]|uniref:Uncharacterized protein n=1 Tax=Trichonephila inaurata madagascariensis TaxID=2747483 RepID=A0A8X6WQ55_9ARAC|nr:hypothetical protein TNIN_408371 [Trichonephila inaurata madagascariensis]
MEDTKYQAFRKTDKTPTYANLGLRYMVRGQITGFHFVLQVKAFILTINLFHRRELRNFAWRARLKPIRGNRYRRRRRVKFANQGAPVALRTRWTSDSFLIAAKGHAKKPAPGMGHGVAACLPAATPALPASLFSRRRHQQLKINEASPLRQQNTAQNS